MTANLKVLVPEETTNYVQNPSLRYGDTGWVAVKSTMSRVLDYRLYGISSLKVVTDILSTKKGVYYRVSSLLGINEAITASVYARGNGSVHLRLWNTGGKEWISTPVSLHPQQWKRLEVSGFSTGTNDIRLYVETDKDEKNVTFYVDGAQVERKPYATSYCDGDRPGCRWAGMDSFSNSTRNNSTRQGGRWVSLAGPCRTNNDIYITVLGGMGMPPLQHSIQPWAMSPGSYFQNTKILDRAVTISFHIKNTNLNITDNPDSSQLHEFRQQLINIFKPDLTGGSEPFLFSYQEGERELFISMYYESGLEGSWDIRNQWTNSFPVRFLAVDPIFSENNFHAQALNFIDDFMARNALARIDGKWSDMAGGLDSDVADLIKGRYGKMIYVGLFIKDYLTTITLNRIGYWQGDKWLNISTGANGTINDVAFSANDEIYVTGAFTQIGGVAANRIAKWNGTVWSALGAGLNQDGLMVAVAPNGDVYAGGKFTTAGGVSSSYVARWDGISWNAMGAFAGLNDYVYSIAISKDGQSIYVAGKFTDQRTLAGSALLSITKYSLLTNTFSAVGSGLTPDVKEVVISPSGILYVCGAFTSSGATPLYFIAKWNGSTWIQIGDTITGTYIASMDVSENEQIIAVGPITKVNNVQVNGIALWNGSSWTNLDLDICRGSIVPSLKTVRFVGEDIYLGGQGFIAPDKKSVFSAINTIINLGTAETSPFIYVYGPGRLRWIENQTTHKRIYLDMSILDNEEILFDFGKGTVTSDARGDLTYTILSGSDFSNFTLIPGKNTIAVFMTDDVDSMMYIYYQPKHWSADATVDAEALP